MAPPKSRFTDGEKVLCFHGPLLYEAKCLKSQIRDKVMKYFIHYSGWNKNWDEWVPDCRVLKYNDTNLQKQKDLLKTHTKAKKPKSVKGPLKKDGEKESTSATPSEKNPKSKTEKKAASSSSPELFESESKKKKSRSEPCFLDEVKPDPEIRLDIPSPLKERLVDDWDLITRQKKILSLPARVTVDHVIANYVKEKVSVKGLSQKAENTIVQVSNRIRDCFNILLGKMLLYKFERPQYSEMLAEYPGSSVCQLYSAVHLLRMFTKIGTLLTSISSTVKDISVLVGHLNDFIRYLSTNNNFFSLEDYVVASPEYHRRAL